MHTTKAKEGGRMKYRRLTTAAIAVPKQDSTKPFQTSSILPFGTVIGLMSKNQPSPITVKQNELTIKWKTMSGKEQIGWVAIDTLMDDRMTKKELSRGSGELRVSAWDVVRKHIASAPGWTVRKWVCVFAETNLPLLHAVIRELGGKVPKTDDQFAAISRVVKLATGKEITMKEVEEVQETAKKKGKKSSKKGSSTKVSSKKEKKSSKKSKSSKKNGAGRVSEFAGKRIIRLQKENPRREGSQGWKSWSVIKKGMTYEEFLKAGGSRGSLAKEVKNKRVKMK
jgi:hypothetical protein